MAFEKGKSGNPDGRPKGAGNKVNTKVKALITNLVENSFESVKLEFDQLEGRDKVRLWVDMLPYLVPKMQSVQAGFDFERLSDEDLDAIINELKGEA